MLNEWWTGINGLEKAFWFIALPFTAVLLVQLIMTFTGMGDNQGGDDGFDDAQDDSGDGAFRLFTVRNFIILFSVFGWSGVTFASIGINNILTVILSIVLGFIVMLIVAALFYFSNKLTENGTMNINLAMGMTGEVYLPIPGKKLGQGKFT